MSEKQPNPNLRVPAGVHVPELASVPEIPKPSKLITITVAEYHLLLKSYTLLEAIMFAEIYDRSAFIEAAKKALAFSEAGAEE